MPWDVRTKMRQRQEFVVDHRSGLYGMRELCERYGVSRVTGYKWLRRCEELGWAGLDDRPPIAASCPHATSEEVRERLVGFRRKHPDWGSRKVLRRLRGRYPDVHWPAASTATEVFRRAGLLEARRRRRRLEHPGRPSTKATEPNELWAADFKGQFRMGDGQYCYPLTVTDSYSRYLLGCRGLANVRSSGARAVFERLFREYGLPRAIRTDNGSPFASTAIGRLSRLSVWWIRLGVRPELIEPGHPEQNGAHERMHRTMKKRLRPPGVDLADQQKRLNRFRTEYNEERPHEALGQETPASVYVSSPREYPRTLPGIEYPGHFEVRRVSRNGGVRWKKEWLNVSHALAEEYVGFEEVDDGVWSLYFGPLLLARFEERELRLYGARPYESHQPEV
jgi:transposase InsO family protein